MGMTNSDWKEAYNIVCDDRDAMRSAHGKAVDRIRELEAEIAVRDNMGNEVLRILREATGKRDFHSEMEAAEYAAELIRQGGWRPIAEAQERKWLFVGKHALGEWYPATLKKSWAIANGYTHYLPEPEPPAREVENG